MYAISTNSHSTTTVVLSKTLLGGTERIYEFLSHLRQNLEMVPVSHPLSVVLLHTTIVKTLSLPLLLLSLWFEISCDAGMTVRCMLVGRVIVTATVVSTKTIAQDCHGTNMRVESSMMVLSLRR